MTGAENVMVLWSVVNPLTPLLLYGHSYIASCARLG